MNEGILGWIANAYPLYQAPPSSVTAKDKAILLYRR